MSCGTIIRAFGIMPLSNTFMKNLALRSTDCACKLQYYSSKPTTRTVKDPVTGEIKKKKTSIIPKITLIHGQDLTITTLEEAQKLSKRRDLRLVKIIDIDTKTQRPVYKLMTGSEYHAEDLKQRELKKIEKEKNNVLKGEKLLILSQNISEHDLMTNVRKIIKWIAKSYEVRVVINGDNSNISKAETVYQFLEKSIDVQGRILQKRQKGSDIKFQIIPPKKDKEDKEGNNL